MIRTSRRLAGGAVLLLAASAAASFPVGFESLLDEMADPGAIAAFPDPAFKLLSASSYERLSDLRNGPAWYANNDYSHFLRSETIEGRKEWVLMDARNPGAVVRFWAAPANAGQGITGTLRIYFDGAATPSLEMGMEAFLNGGLAGPPLSESTAHGRNLYLPIPYAKACKITVDKPHYWETRKDGDRLWYVINYREYPPGTQVTTFSRDDLAAAATAVKALEQRLKAPLQAVPAGARSLTFPMRTLSASSAPLRMALEGPGAVRLLSLKVKSADADRALQGLRLRARYDGRITVGDVPAGHFFAAGGGFHPTAGWRSEVGKDTTLTSFWVMPFAQEAVLEVFYAGAGQAEVAAELRLGPWTWLPGRSLHFHARWKQEQAVPTRPYSDWSFLKLEGRGGVYAGDVLSIRNGTSQWWGEGDEKIFVDGEALPSNFGTGTEDYYGYAWGNGQVFQSAFHGQPRGAGNAAPATTVNWRMRGLDGIPFRTAFEFNLETWHWSDTRVDQALAAFWYAFPGETYAFEGEELERRVTGGAAAVQRDWSRPWSAGAQLWWTGPVPGDTLALDLLVPEDGLYAVSARFTRAPDYGRFDLWLDTAALAHDLDLHAAAVQVPAALALGRIRLTSGRHALRAVARAANPAAQPGRMLGLDQVILRRLPDPTGIRRATPSARRPSSGRKGIRYDFLGKRLEPAPG